MINSPLYNANNSNNSANAGYGRGGSASQPNSYPSSPLASPRLLPSSARMMMGPIIDESQATSTPFDQPVQKLREFLTEAPQIMSQQPDKPILQYTMGNGEIISCVRWNGQYFISGTDVVRILLFRFQRANRPVMNTKKFEEGVFSDLRMLKPGSGAVLEEPRSAFLDFMYKHNCIRTQKKQKVFHWYSVAHDQLYWDAMERELKRENSLHNINLFMLNEKRQREMLYAAAAQQTSMAAPFMSMGYGTPTNSMLGPAPYPGAFLPSLTTGGANNGCRLLPPSNIMMASTGQMNPQIPPPPGPQPNGKSHPSAPSLAALQLSASFGVDPNAVFGGNNNSLIYDSGSSCDNANLPPVSPSDPLTPKGKVKSLGAPEMDDSTIDSFFNDTTSDHDLPESMLNNLGDTFMVSPVLNTDNSFADSSSVLMSTDSTSDYTSLLSRGD